MKLIATIDGEVREVTIAEEDGVLRADIEGREYKLDASKPESNVYLFKHGNSVHEFSVIRRKDGTFLVSDTEGEGIIGVSDPRKLGGPGAAGAAADGVAEIVTQMPGKVVRIIAKEGDEVVSGDGVIVVEAMKMQNEMKSPKDGAVKKILKQEGETVNAGDVLVVIE